MTEPKGSGQRSAAEPEEAVDLDLDAEDALLREAVGKPTSVRVGGKVVHISHAADWSNEAMSAASKGNWDTWAEEVIDDEDELQIWQDANLHNYQIEAVFSVCGSAAKASAGKSRKSVRSSRSSRRH